ncbi:MAG: hypothetical protein VB878_25075, partial [Pirellulaceae bacterium]
MNSISSAKVWSEKSDRRNGKRSGDICVFTPSLLVSDHLGLRAAMYSPRLVSSLPPGTAHLMMTFEYRNSRILNNSAFDEN